MGPGGWGAGGSSGGAGEILVHDRLPLEIVGGQGAWLEAADGRRFLDFYGGHATNLLGQGHPRLVATLRNQAGRVFFQTNLVELETRRRAAEELAAFAPEGLERVFFVNSGAEANENALRLAFMGNDRKRVVAVEGSFHGRTGAAGACTHGARRKWYAFPRTPFEVTFIPRDDPASLERAMDEDAAALIVEAVQGVAGARPLAASWLRRARALCDASGSVFIADEIQCGMGRTGKGFAIEDAGVVPDVITVAKGLAGGFPAGAVIAKEEVAARAGRGALGTTFGGGPLATALIAAVLREIREGEWPRHALAMEELIRTHCAGGCVKEIQGRGLLLGLRTGPPAAWVRDRLLEEGVLAGTAADPRILRLMPPLIIQEEHVLHLARALERIASEGLPLAGEEGSS